MSLHMQAHTPRSTQSSHKISPISCLINRWAAVWAVGVFMMPLLSRLVLAGQNSVRVSCKRRTAEAQSIGSPQCANTNHYDSVAITDLPLKSCSGVVFHAYWDVYISSQPLYPSILPTFIYPSSVNYHLVLMRPVGLLWCNGAGKRGQGSSSSQVTHNSLTHSGPI